MERHLRAVAYLHSLAGCAGLVVLAVGLLDRWLGQVVLSEPVPAGAVALGTLLVIPLFASYRGLLLRRSWGRLIALALSFLALVFFPVGTLLALYSFWVLLHPKTTELFGGGLF